MRYGRGNQNVWCVADNERTYMHQSSTNDEEKLWFAPEAFVEAKATL